MLCLSPGVALADEAVPVSGAFVTLERASGGTLKYSGTGADGTFVILSLSQGKYRMSITPPKRDRTPEFAMAVQGNFEGIIVIPGGKVVKAPDDGKAEVRRRKKPGSTILIPPSIWKQKAIWLDVEIVLEDVKGRFDYVLSDAEEVSVMVLRPEEKSAGSE